ncbi:hypothetical protein RFI_10424, partial [Reticulomyxa filosa]
MSRDAYSSSEDDIFEDNVREVHDIFAELQQKNSVNEAVTDENRVEDGSVDSAIKQERRRNGESEKQENVTTQDQEQMNDEDGEVKSRTKHKLKAEEDEIGKEKEKVSTRVKVKEKEKGKEEEEGEEERRRRRRRRRRGGGEEEEEAVDHSGLLSIDKEMEHYYRVSPNKANERQEKKDDHQGTTGGLDMVLIHPSKHEAIPDFHKLHDDLVEEDHNIPSELIKYSNLSIYEQ